MSISMYSKMLYCILFYRYINICFDYSEHIQLVRCDIAASHSYYPRAIDFQTIESNTDVEPVVDLLCVCVCVISNYDFITFSCEGVFINLQLNSIRYSLLANDFDRR